MTKQAVAEKTGETFDFESFTGFLRRRLSLVIHDKDRLHHEATCACHQCTLHGPSEINGHAFRLATNAIGNQLLLYKVGCARNEILGHKFLPSDLSNEEVRTLALNRFSDKAIGQRVNHRPPTRTRHRTNARRRVQRVPR